MAELSARRISRPGSNGWTLEALLQLAADLAQDGSVLVGIDAALGVPAGYWRAVQARDWDGGGTPATFIDWLRRLDPADEFFEPVDDPSAWRVDRPFFRVPGRKGGLSDFKNRFDDGFLRPIDRLTGAKPLFAVSGIPGTVGSGTRALWKELIPLLQPGRELAVWPFQGALPELLGRRGIVLAETYPGLAYAAALAESLPATQLKVAKTKSESRLHACHMLEAAPWVAQHGVDLGDLNPARDDEDAFDSHLTASAVLRCGLEGRALCDDEWIDRHAGGAMLLAGPVDPSRPARSIKVAQRQATRTAFAPVRRPIQPVESINRPVVRSAPPSHPAASTGKAVYTCPIPGCSKVFTNTRGGWDAHVASLRQHPDWYPGITDPDHRKRLFRTEYGSWFQ